MHREVVIQHEECLYSLKFMLCVTVDFIRENNSELEAE